MIKRTQLLFVTMLLSLIASAESGYVGETIGLTLNPETDSQYTQYQASSAVWRVVGTYESNGTITFNSIDRTATVRFNTYTTDQIRISCQYQVTNAAKTAFLNKTTYFTVTCSSVSILPNPSSLSMKVGDKEYIAYTTSPSDKRPTVSYSSSNTNVAAVDDYGKVTAIAKGYAIITLSNSMGPDATVSVSITGEPDDNLKVSSITIGTPSAMTVGETQVLTATVFPNNATNKTVKWSSGNTTVATIHETTGLVTAKSAGTTIITCTATDGSDVKATCSIAVSDSPKPKLSISANPTGGNVDSGTKVYLTAKAEGSSVSDADIYYTKNGTTPTKSSTKYTSSGITISSACTLKAISYKDGYETSDVLIEAYTIKSNPKLTLSATPSGGEVATGAKVTLTAEANGSTVSADIYYTLNGMTPTKSSTKYTSSGISITEACTLKAIAYKDGYETSNISSWNYSLKKETIAPTTIVVSPSSKTIGVGESFYASYTLTPSNANYKTNVRWNSENEDIATVDSYGIVVGKKAGQTYINATTENGKTHWCKVTIVSDLNDNDIIAVSGGYMHSFALKRDGSLWAFGGNGNGQLGDNTYIERHSPVKIMTDVVSISAAHNSSFILKNDGSLWGCGSNGDGQLGMDVDWDTEESFYKTAYKPTPVKILDNVSSVATGGNHVLAIKTDGSLWTWGHNEQGQLGDGTTIDRSSPMKIMDNVASVAGGSYESYIVKKDGSLWACGWLDGRSNYSWNYQLTPKKIMDNVKSVSSGTGSTLVVKTDGSLWGFGSNSDGQLGDGSTEYRENPVKIMDGVKYASTSEGGIWFYHSLIVKDDNTLWACGSNYRGQLGDGTKVSRYTPKKIMNGVAFAETGAIHSLIVKTDGTLWTCGANNDGQLGDDSTTDKPSFVKIEVSDVIAPSDIDITGVGAIEVGKTIKANYSLKPEKAETTVTWTSDTPDIALVLPSGEVKGLKSGQAVIRATTANGMSSKVMVDVYFLGKTEEGVNMKFQVINEDEKQCTVGTNWYDEYAIDQSTQGKITIPEKINGYEVVKIGGMAFYDCKEITSISIPKTVSQMERWGIFNCCDNLETIYSFIEKPTNMTTDAFMLSEWQHYSNAILYVPYGTKSMYESTDGWKNIKNIVEMALPTIELKTSSAGHATFYDSRSAYTLPYNLSAIVVANVSNSKLTYKAIADGSVSGVIPKGTAVMLVSDNKQAGTYTLTVSESTATYSGTNFLRGSDEATTTTGDGYHYKLSYGPSGTDWSDVFGWYWGAANGGAFQIEGHKAWLVVPKSAGARAFSVDGETMGIETIGNGESAIGSWYDLQGRRINQPARKGMYIRNGKKYINK